MNASQSESPDAAKREPRRRRRRRIPGAIFAACIGVTSFFNVAGNPRFEAIHTLDVIRLLTAGAGFGVALVLVIWTFVGDDERAEAS